MRTENTRRMIMSILRDQWNVDPGKENFVSLNHICSTAKTRSPHLLDSVAVAAVAQELIRKGLIVAIEADDKRIAVQLTDDGLAWIEVDEQRRQDHRLAQIAVVTGIVGAITGVIGALTGIVALLQK